MASNLLKRFIFTMEVNIRTMLDDTSYITVTPQQAERNHYIEISGILYLFGDATFFPLFSE